MRHVADVQGHQIGRALPKGCEAHPSHAFGLLIEQGKKCQAVKVQRKSKEVDSEEGRKEGRKEGKWPFVSTF